MTRTHRRDGPLGTFSVSAAQVAIANQSVSSSASALDLASVDSSITKRVGGGSLLMNVNNPFNVTGNLDGELRGRRDADSEDGSARRRRVVAGRRVHQV